MLMEEEPVEETSLDEEARSEDEDENEFAQVQASAKQDAQNRPFKAWAVVAKSYMQLPCLHEANLHEVTLAVPGRKSKRRKFESALIVQAVIAILNVDMKLWDRESAPIDEAFIEKVGEVAGFTGASKLNAADLFTYLKDANLINTGRIAQASNAIVSSSSHCESILMSLIAIANDNEIRANINDE